MPSRYFEDFAAGQIFELPDVAVSREDIIEFSQQFDPQIFHLQDETPITEFGGGLIASGWQVCSLFMRLLDDGLLLDSSCAGSPGVEHLKWQHAVRPGDHLTGRTTVVETRNWPSNAKLGLVRFHHEVFNQHRERTMMMDNAILFGRRSAP
jgi:acyl dehydratase